MRGERFCSWMRQNGTKFSRHWKVEFQKSFMLYRQILLNVLTKVGINFVHFEWSKVSIILTLGFILLTLAWAKWAKWRQGLILCSNQPFFPTNHPNLENNYWNLADSLTKFSKIFFSFTDPNGQILVLNKMLQC
jgi:hypothetical protein